jgi:hypothetical protein
MKKLVALTVMVLVPIAVLADGVSFSDGVVFSGSPSYVSEFATAFRDNGGPLSPYGSHFGLKAQVRSRRFAGVEHYACMTGKNRLDYSRTGLMGSSFIEFMVDGVPSGEALDRKINFVYYGWEEAAEFDEFTARARVFFLGLDQYVIAAGLKNRAGKTIELAPVFNLEKRGKTLSPAKDSGPGEWVLKFAVQPTTALAGNYLAVLPSEPGAGAPVLKKGLLTAPGSPLTLSPGQERWLWFIAGYSPDGPEKALAMARKARENFPGPEEAWQEMILRRDEFFHSLPAPHIPPADHGRLDLYRMTATALDNALYAPRGDMKRWACVPTKVHYNWFWLWDSGLQALGYSEFRPAMARDVILSMFDAQRPDGFIAHMADERGKPLTPHSQSPVFGYSAARILSRHPEAPGFTEFKKELYDKSKLYLGWWKKRRDVNRNGLFEFLSQDEGGWDNSPRMNYVTPIIFISYYGSLGELIAAKLKPLDTTDLNAWIYAYYRAMEGRARELGKPGEAKGWRQEAMELASRIDEILWDEEAGCWLDAYTRPGSKERRHFRVLTPHVWFPAFTGATRDEQKARRVIEEHLLDPEEFFGKYPIPTVAYNDPFFDATTNSWKGSIWMITAYSALEALWRFGYAEEAAQLRERLLSMMEEQDGMKAIYETYDPLTGRYKTGNSDGGYASAQFGWSSAFAMEMVLERHQEERFVFADTRSIKGHIRRAEDFYTRDDFFWIEAGLDPPLVELTSNEEAPLLNAGSFTIKLSDPYRTQKAETFSVRIRGERFTVPLGRESVIGIE